VGYRKYVAEFVGTAILVVVGCGSVVVADFGSAGATRVLAIALAFGFIVTGLAYSLGPVSGCHLNPAVTLSVVAAGRMQVRDVPGYVIAQMAGALGGAAVLAVLLAGRLKGYDLSTGGLGQNGWGENYLGGYSAGAAFAAEAVATFILCLVVLGVTGDGGSRPFAGVAIGLTLAVLLIAFINVSGASLNPARSFGPAVFVGGQAIAQLWLFIVAPIVGGFAAGMLTRLLEWSGATSAARSG
jgi:aquaporin Z